MQWSESPGDDRGSILAHLEEASGQTLSVGDALPDELIAAAQREGISRDDVVWWIHSPHPEGWSAAALVRDHRRRLQEAHT